MQCAQNGANIILLDKNRRGLTALSDRITGNGLAAPGLYPMDLAGAGIDDFSSLVETIKVEHGSLNALIHCAVDFEGLQPLDQIKPLSWLKSMQVNVNAPWLLSCACLPLLKQEERSHLFFLLDDLDKVSGAYWGAYGTSKAALTGLVKQFVESLSNTKVIVRGIIPGVMRTAFRASAYHAENPLNQPGPEIAARKIIDLVLADKLPRGVIVNITD